VPFFNNGSGVGSQGNGSTTTAVLSSIIAGNVGAAGGTGSDINFVDAPFTNSFQSQGYNVIGTGNALAAFTGAGDKTGITAPLLGPLANNGGPTRTHALLAGSPAVNAGSPSFNPTTYTPPLTTDQRGTGFPRVMGGRIDAGAFESALSAFSADFDLDGDVDGRDFLAWQRGVGINAGATKAQGDANGDGRVNSADLTLLKAQFGGVSSEAAMAPLAVSGGDETPPAVFAPTSLAAVIETPAAPPASTSASDSPTSASPSGVGYVAGAGVPGAARAARPSYRPPVERRAAVDAVYAAHGAAKTAAATAQATAAEFSIGSDATADEATGEDAVFALLGDGLL
jgi:hypothetical protein